MKNNYEASTGSCWERAFEGLIGSLMFIFYLLLAAVAVSAGINAHVFTAVFH